MAVGGRAGSSGGRRRRGRFRVAAPSSTARALAARKSVSGTALAVQLACAAIYRVGIRIVAVLPGAEAICFGEHDGHAE